MSIFQNPVNNALQLAPLSIFSSEDLYEMCFTHRLQIDIDMHDTINQTSDNETESSLLILLSWFIEILEILGTFQNLNAPTFKKCVGISM